MNVADWLIITAVLLSPLIAVQLTRFLDNKKEKRERRLMVFKTLMATRGVSLSYQHVEALNRIDLEFGSGNAADKRVIEAWKAYLDLLADSDMPPDHWGLKRVDLFVDLLHSMAQVLNYEFDKTHIKNSSYSPKLYGDIESFQNEMRVAMRELMEGKRVLPVWIANTPSPQQDESLTEDESSHQQDNQPEEAE